MAQQPSKLLLTKHYCKHQSALMVALHCKLSNLVNSIIAVLTTNRLTSDNYATSSFSLYPNPSYANGVSIVVSQIVSQNFLITKPSITKDGSNIGKLIDSLATVNGILLRELSFDIKDKTSVYQKARQQPYQNAQSKARDYAIALQLGLVRPITQLGRLFFKCSSHNPT